MIPSLSISSVVTTSVCPVRFHLGRKSGTTESPHYTIAKQLSYHLGRESDKEEIWSEISLIQNEDPQAVRDFFDECISLCSINKAWRRYSDSDVKVHSTQHQIHGIVDKLFDEDPFFSIVRPSRAPSSGIYTADRIRIAAYTVCLQEMFGTEIEGGEVEYIPSGISRYCRVEPLDKRRFLRALHEARRIKNGEIPRRPAKPPCERCPEKGRCEPEYGIRLSDLL